jgi:hypothetical protein
MSVDQGLETNSKLAKSGSIWSIMLSVITIRYDSVGNIGQTNGNGAGRRGVVIIFRQSISVDVTAFCGPTQTVCAPAILAGCA